MLFETIKSEGLAHLSYLLGSDGAAVVIDPRRDIDVYLRIARRNGLRITHILETHVHADFVSGSRELAARTGAQIYGGAIDENKEGYGFALQALRDEDEVCVGALRFRARHTPGHSAEHLSYVISGGGAGAEHEWGVFTGDTLFAGEVGRPDLGADDESEALARALYTSLHEKLMTLDDAVEIYPAHGEGSPCGASIGARDRTTIGYERAHNAWLQVRGEDAFVDKLLETLEDAPAPSYYARMKVLNREGPAVVGARPTVPPLSAAAFAERIEQGATVVDTREIDAFAAAHIEGALNIPLRTPFPMWAGRILEPEDDVVLVVSDGDALDKVALYFFRLNLSLDAWLGGGFRSWFEAGRAYTSTGLMSVHELKESLDDAALQVLDVREPAEYKRGAIPGAKHIFVPDLKERVAELDRDRPVATYCGSGYRASIAASLLAQQGFSTVYNVPGSFKAWAAADYPTESPSEQE